MLKAYKRTAWDFFAVTFLYYFIFIYFFYDQLNSDFPSLWFKVAAACKDCFWIYVYAYEI